MSADDADGRAHDEHAADHPADGEPGQDPNRPFENTDDVDGIDLTPRSAPPVGGSGSARGRRLGVTAVLVALAVGLVFVAYQGLSNATVFFKNADEAVAQRDDLGTDRFRLQGRVVADSITSDGIEVRFAVEHNGVEVPVHHVGDPPELFQVGIPVVLEGSWSDVGEWFDSDRILVKHDSTYQEDNPDRVDDYVGKDSALE